MREKRIPDKVWDDIYSKVPRFCVDLLIRKNGGILLTKRTIEPSRGLWSFPGGTLYFGEMIEECAKRIAKNELGAEIKLGKVVGVGEHLNEDIGHYKRHSIGLVVEADIGTIEPSLNEEANEFKFFTVLPEKMNLVVKEFLIEHGYLKNSKP